MKYLFCLMFLIIQAPLFLHAQSNYKPGYIVNSKNDTLKGFIDYREWIKNPTEVNFKQTPTALPQKFSPANANAFAITNDVYYEKFIVKKSTSGVKLEDLSNKLDTAFITDTVFLENLVNGKNVSLYELTNKLKSSYYILDKNAAGINYLKQYLYMDEGQHSIVNANTYIYQLLKLASIYQPGNKKIISNIQKATYSEDDLSAIAIALNGGSATQQAIHSSAGIRFFAGAAISYSKLQFKSSANAGPFSNGVRDNSASPVLAAGLDFMANKYTEKLIIRLELSAATNQYQFSQTFSGLEDIKNSLAIKEYHFSATPQIMYNFYNTDKFKAFIDVGLAMNVYKYNDYNFVTTRVFGSSTSVSNQNKYPDFEGFIFSVPVKAGVQINKRIELYGTYRLPSSIVKYTMFSADQSAFQAGINYIFR